MTPRAILPIALATPRLLLRPFEPRDLDALRAYRDDPEFARYLPSLPRPYTRTNAEADLAEYMALPPDTHPYWAITLDGRVIGNIDAHLETPLRALIGYAIARNEWGRGLTTEAAQAVVDWTFEHTDVVRVYAEADARNIASRRVMEKVGMRHEGTLRVHHDDRGVPADYVVYGILRTEWERPRADADAAFA